jgi:hypothetical protein
MKILDRRNLNNNDVEVSGACLIRRVIPTDGDPASESCEKDTIPFCFVFFRLPFPKLSPV